MTTRSIAYLRVSTDHQADSGLGIDAQRERCAAYAAAMGYEPVTVAVDAGVSGTTPDKRLAMARALRDLDNGAAAVLIVASLSRLGRSTRDVLDLAARADANGWALAILDLNLDTAAPTGRFTLTMLAAVAQLERDQTSERTAAALAAKKAQGARLGRPASEATRTAGARALDLRADGLIWRAVAQALTDEGYITREGGPWPPHAQRAARTVALDRDAADSNQHTPDPIPGSDPPPSPALRRIGLPIVVEAPAGDRVVAAHPARMQAAGGDGLERARRRITQHEAPAGDRVVGGDSARMRAAGGDGLERARRRIGLPLAVVAPAFDGVVAAHPARMRAAGGDGLERAQRRIRLPVAPAGDRVVAEHPAMWIVVKDK